MENYQRTAQPLIDFYQHQRMLISIVADGSPEEIYRETMAALGGRITLVNRLRAL